MRLRGLPARRGLWLIGAILVCMAAAPAARAGDGPRFADAVTMPEREAQHFDFARLDGDRTPAVRALAEAVAGLAPLAQLQAVNARVNRVPLRADLDNYGVADHWATPQEFFRRGGDCEDYAIAKYAVLERLGWPPARMWIVVLRETVISPMHAVLMVQHDGALWTLDNLGDRLFVHGQIDFYRPAYSLNRLGAWSHGGQAWLSAYRGFGARP